MSFSLTKILKGKKKNCKILKPRRNKKIKSQKLVVQAPEMPWPGDQQYECISSPNPACQVPPPGYFLKGHCASVTKRAVMSCSDQQQTRLTQLHLTWTLQVTWFHKGFLNSTLGYMSTWAQYLQYLQGGPPHWTNKVGHDSGFERTWGVQIKLIKDKGLGQIYCQ